MLEDANRGFVLLLKQNQYWAGSRPRSRRQPCYITQLNQSVHPLALALVSKLIPLQAWLDGGGAYFVICIAIREYRNAP